jgi:hypothetical protein
MRLVELDPAFVQGDPRGLFITLLCPTCGKHHVGVPVRVGVKEPGYWMISSQDFNTLTLEPSILHNWNAEVPVDQRCPYHFRILNGEIIQC